MYMLMPKLLNIEDKRIEIIRPNKRGGIFSLRCYLFHIHLTCVQYLLDKVFIFLD
jgi:hypothetical protein